MSQRLLLELAEGAGGILPITAPSPTTTSSEASPSFMRCLQPYRHAHSTATKGRWLKKPLLEVFAREFAVVGDLNGVDSTEDDVPVLPTVSTDPVVNAFLYARELVDGTLYIERSEKECVAAGKAYIDFMKHYDPHTGKRHIVAEKNEDTSEHIAQTIDVDDEAANWTLDKFTNSGGTVAPKSDADIDAFFDALPKLLILKQSNRFVHVVNRSEHSVNLTDGPIEIAHIARHRKNDASSSSASSNAALPPSFIAVSKPSSIGIHPAGRFQKNTLLKIVEEIFNGGLVVNKGGAAHTSQRGKLLYGLLIKETVVDVENNPSSATSLASSQLQKQRFTDIFEPLFQRSEEFVNSPSLSSSNGPPKVYSLVPTSTVPTQPDDGTATEEDSTVTATTESNRQPFQFSPVPTIRIPHSKVSEEDRMWLLSKILLQDLKSSTNGDVTTVPSMHGDRRVVFGSEKLKRAVMDAAASTRGLPDAVPLKLYIVHRLDRSTSGIIILALDGKSATAITDTFAASEKEAPIIENNNNNDGDNNITGRSGWTFTSMGARVVTNTTCDTTKRNKQYLAKVYGDMRQLIQRLSTEDKSNEENHGGIISPSTATFVQAILPLQPSSPSTTTTEGASTSIPSTYTIITNGAIHCVSCQLAQYWCLGAVEQRRYEDYLQATAKENSQHTLGNTTAPTTTSASSGKRSREEGGDYSKSNTNELATVDSISNTADECVAETETTLSSRVNSCVEIEKVQQRAHPLGSDGGDNTTAKKGGGENGEWLTFTGVKENRAAVWDRVYGRRGINGPAPLLDNKGNPISQDSESAHFNNFLKLKSAVSSLTVVAVTKVDPVTLKEVQVPLDRDIITSGNDTYYSYVACTPHTGRTHQLRIHLAACGYPIVKDTKYQQYLRRLQEEALAGAVSVGGNAQAEKCSDDKALAKPDDDDQKKEEGGGGGGGGDFLDPEIICLHAHSYTLPIQKATATTNSEDSSDASNLTVVTAEAPSWYLGPRDFTSLHTQ